MKTPAPNHEELDPLSAALRRDAARVQEPPFDPALHHALLRRIRAVADESAAQWSWGWRSALAGVAALAVLALCLGLGLPPTASNTTQYMTPPPVFDEVLVSTRMAVARLAADASSPQPAWMSPTAALLDSLYPPFIKIEHQL
jgi:anti-sigma-K factor RskA